MPTLNLPARGEKPWDEKNNANLQALSDAIDAALPAAQKGAASGVAPLDSGSRVPDANLPVRLGSAALTAAFVGILPNTGSLTYDSNGNVTTDQDGTVYTYNSDGTVHTITRGSVTRTLTYNPDGTIASVA